MRPKKVFVLVRSINPCGVCAIEGDAETILKGRNASPVPADIDKVAKFFKTARVGQHLVFIADKYGGDSHLLFRKR